MKTKLINDVALGADGKPALHPHTSSSAAPTALQRAPIFWKRMSGRHWRWCSPSHPGTCTSGRMPRADWRSS
jgi:hypothetical protein